MALELIYTSAPKGIKIGSSGFTTVAYTRGMASNYVTSLERISGYKWAHKQKKHKDSPVAFSHFILEINGNKNHVLSRIGPCGVDYSKRSNKIAHHIVLNDDENQSCDSARLLQCQNMFIEKWTGNPQLIDREVMVPEIKAHIENRKIWSYVTGDSMWADNVAQHLGSHHKSICYLIYSHDTDVLEMIAEVIEILPTHMKWDITFSTYYTVAIPGVDCRFRCCLEGTEEASKAKRLSKRDGNIMYLDLTSKLGTAPIVSLDFSSNQKAQAYLHANSMENVLNSKRKMQEAKIINKTPSMELTTSKHTKLLQPNDFIGQGSGLEGELKRSNIHFLVDGIMFVFIIVLIFSNYHFFKKLNAERLIADIISKNNKEIDKRLDSAQNNNNMLQEEINELEEDLKLSKDKKKELVAYYKKYQQKLEDAKLNLEDKLKNLLDGENKPSPDIVALKAKINSLEKEKGILVSNLDKYHIPIEEACNIEIPFFESELKKAIKEKNSGKKKVSFNIRLRDSEGQYEIKAVHHKNIKKDSLVVQYHNVNNSPIDFLEVKLINSPNQLYFEVLDKNITKEQLHGFLKDFWIEVKNIKNEEISFILLAEIEIELHTSKSNKMPSYIFGNIGITEHEHIKPEYERIMASIFNKEDRIYLHKDNKEQGFIKTENYYAFVSFPSRLRGIEYAFCTFGFNGDFDIKRLGGVSRLCFSKDDPNKTTPFLLLTIKAE